MRGNRRKPRMPAIKGRIKIILAGESLRYKRTALMQRWFTIDQLDCASYIISEYRHREETHCYFLNGTERSLLMTQGWVFAIYTDEIKNLRENPLRPSPRIFIGITSTATGIFPIFIPHEAELAWLHGGFPLPVEAVRRSMLIECDAPEYCNVKTYALFQGTPVGLLQDGEDGDVIDLGGRSIQALYTPGHSPGHMCFFAPDRGHLFTGDLVYKGTLYANYPSTDPEAYLASLEKIAALPIKCAFPAHHKKTPEPTVQESF